jgi:hypothetical protein
MPMMLGSQSLMRIRRSTNGRWTPLNSMGVVVAYRADDFSLLPPDTVLCFSLGGRI